MSAFNIEKDRYELFHRASTAVNLSQDIQHGRGKASIINGDIFYSPNSTDDVQLPPPIKLNSTIWRNSKKSSSVEFHQPLWWSPETAFLAFLPKHPELFGEPLGDLFDVPIYFDRSQFGYVLDPAVTLKWKRLEVCLIRISEILVHFSKAVEPRRILRTAISTKVCKTARSFRLHMNQARNWFSVWMAQVSYAIAASLSVANHDHSAQPNHIPEWYSFLLSEDFRLDGWDQAYLSGIRQSMGSFSPHVLRSGIFLQVVSSPPHQFSVDWLQKYYVPVWYPWGQKEIDAARTAQHVARLTPPPDKLQAVATFLSKTPLIHTSGGPGCAHTGKENKEPWVTFLAERAERLRKRIEYETPEERQIRQNRARQPAIRKARVYVWEKDGNSDGYVRVLVSQQHNESILADYSSTQKVYNPVENEWDCCEELGDDVPDDDKSDTDDDDEPDAGDYEHADAPIADGYFDQSEPHSPLAPTSHPSSAPSSHSGGSVEDAQTSISRCVESEYAPARYNAYQLLRDFLGFVSPLPLPIKNGPRSRLNNEQEKIVLNLLGLREREADCPSIPISADIWSFLEGFDASNVRLARTSIWDLAPGNRVYLEGCKNLFCMHVIDGEKINGATEKLYIFDFGRDATVSWLLAVTNIINALFVCRMPRQMDDYDIADDLLKRGIRFRTLKLGVLPPPRDLPTRILPFRLSGYIFSLRDYHAYVRDRDALLHDPRIARAAVMKGGIIWRLVVPFISTRDILAGPSAAISLHSYGLALADGNGRRQLWDDIVSNEELDLICGTYFCFTGHGSQCSRKSWWPPFSVWETNAHPVYWSDLMEKRFQNRLEEIISGKAQPLAATEWRNWLRASSHSRRIMKNIEDASHRFLEAVTVKST